ncbi:hypothetical protein [Beggiatoa leptomitoformis]|uniref:Uncharacterized protein n=1 Tax=Beggiatoa leptomitoformis TaxID=288004 RepID=A0A2N9YHZ8_9GAMM|nr:hypothetical protein [Beggiatoa leptomitoformis]AUI69846.1 hypothetical protein BLE401_14875 [Beggiatoa leptomitoformis]QGX03670.1 hypothetical protein AL038_18905 [Beggiatoa leptomitoformis]
MKPPTPPGWFAQRIISGIQAMYLLNLNNRPASDQVTVTAELWINILWGKNINWDKTLDSERLAKGFQRACAECTEWIAPAKFMEYLPARVYPIALPPPTTSPEKARENLERLYRLIGSMPNKNRG